MRNKGWRKAGLALIGLYCLLSVSPLQVQAVADEEMSFEQFDFSGVDSFLEDTVEGNDISFTNAVKTLVTGGFDEFLSTMGECLKTALFSEIMQNKNAVWQILVVAAIGALFTNFSAIFENSQISDTGFFVTYLLLSALMLSAFMTALSVAAGVIEKLLQFMSALIPSFFLAVVLTGKSVSSMAFYEVTLMAVGAVQWIFLKLLIPAIKIYVLLVFANHISPENMLSKLTDLIKSAVEWTAKTLFGVVLGINLIQGMVLPYVDSVKTNAVAKTLSALPGIGNTIDSAAVLIFGTANLIKNGIGAAALIFITIICIVPVVKLLIIMCMYHGAAAIIQPIADKRLTACVGGIAEGAKLLLKMVFYAASLFLIIIAVVCASTIPAG